MPSMLTMHAIIVDNRSPERSLRWQEIARPQPAPHQVLIKVAACGVNRMDHLQRMGHYPVPDGASPLLGVEVSGEVVACGTQVSQWQVGDLVCALLDGGGYAEYVVADARLCMPIPIGWTLEDAASLPEALFTVQNTLYDHAHLQPGESVLIHGGSSGIGVYALQWLAAAGHPLYTTAGNDEKCAACLQLGAKQAINYQQHDFTPFIELAGGVDVVMDMVGGDYTLSHQRLCHTGGRIAIIAFQGGRHSEVDLGLMLAKRLQLFGVTLRAQSTERKIRMAQQIRQTVWPMLEDGRIKPMVHARYPMADAEQAHHALLQHRHVGKLLLLSKGAA
ncbi:NAD(P)H-quinone oxidoreductase [Leeia aquatica]|uniref:NAD(P)H-quinone oxidoreductase n=1 Tax=Leeia aquatica TaxID=2725557 RepID=A0A847S6X5_9NEIS|nr:NAD(P)H-quinone oxidoreductase [Leeia aquatica]NLR74797.1 NAD(P)H-quinone oxidoreductase [Leeia aquatica]